MVDYRDGVDFANKVKKAVGEFVDKLSLDKVKKGVSRFTDKISADKMKKAVSGFADRISADRIGKTVKRFVGEISVSGAGKTALQVLRDIGDAAKKRPLIAAAIITAMIIGIFAVSDNRETIPGFDEVQWGADKVIDRGGRLGWLGMEVVPISGEIREAFSIPRGIKGLFVIDEGWGIARIHGIKTGDILRAINRRDVDSRRSLRKVIKKIKPHHDGILLDLYRGGRKLFVTIPFRYHGGPFFAPHNRDK